jgi:hypothetical protein
MIKKIITVALCTTTLFCADRFIKSGDVVIDNETKLIWQSNPSTSKRTWQDAKEYCNNLSYGSRSDWRLPNIDELMSLTDKSKYKPSIATNEINIKSSYYWTSSTIKWNTSYAWSVLFSRGYGFLNDKSYEGYVLCVADSNL